MGKRGLSSLAVLLLLTYIGNGKGLLAQEGDRPDLATKAEYKRPVYVGQDSEFRDIKALMKKEVPDSTASDGFCAHFRNQGRHWALQWHYDSGKLQEGKLYTLYAVVKVKLKGKDPIGAAFAYGVYSKKTRKQPIQETIVPTRDVKKNNVWQTYELGDFQPGPQEHVYVAGSRNVYVPDIYVDKFYFVPFEAKTVAWVSGKDVYRLRGARGLDVRAILDNTTIVAGETEKIKIAVLRKGKLDKETFISLRIDNVPLKVERFGSEWHGYVTSDRTGKQKLIIEAGARGSLVKAGEIPLVFKTPQLLTTQLITPSYRGALYLSNLPKEVVVEIQTSSYAGEIEKLKINTQLLDQDGSVIGRGKVTKLKDRIVRLAIPIQTTPKPGQCSLITNLFRGNKKISKSSIKLPAHPQAKQEVIIDEKQNILVNGKRFFPLGIYVVKREQYREVKEAGFNTVLIGAWDFDPTHPNCINRTRAALDTAHEHGLKVLLDIASCEYYIYDPKIMKPVIEAFKDHPALLAWKLVDEPFGRWEIYPRGYQIYKELDPYHPVEAVQAGPGKNGEAYVRVGKFADILGVDPYPVTKLTPPVVTMVSEYLDKAKKAVSERKPIDIALQAFEDKYHRMPTPEEERCMTYLAVVHEPKWICYFGFGYIIKYPELYAEMKKLMSELGQIMPVLVTYESSPIAPVPTDEAIHARIWNNDKEFYFIAVNTLKEGKTLAFRLSPPAKKDRQIEVLFEERKVSIKDGVLSDKFSPYGVHVYRGKL